MDGVGTCIKEHIGKPVFQGLYDISPALANALYSRARELMWWAWKRKHSCVKILEREMPALFVDVSVVNKHDAGTGVQRVVNRVFDELYREDTSILPVAHLGGLLSANTFLERKGLLFDRTEKEYCRFLQGDKLFLLDSSWGHAEYFRKLLEQEHGKIASYAVIHDLFAIQQPELFHSKYFFDTRYFIDIFKKWHDMVLQHVDHVLCISRTTAEQVISYYKQAGFQRTRPLHIYYFRLGSDFFEGEAVARQEIKEFVTKDTFLMVGTVEPRKGYAVVLEAFEQLLQDGKPIKLLIFGKDGWKNEFFHERYTALRSRTDQILWISDGSNGELRWVYEHAGALLAASKDEGFGLPLVEAAHYGIPILCSDIPIFHEVTEDYADFFKVMDKDSLAQALQAWRNSANHPDSRRIPSHSWQDAASEVRMVLEGKAEPYAVLL